MLGGERARVGLVLVATTLWAAPTLGQDRVDGNVYASARYGIQIAKPAAWHFITAQTALDLARKAAGPVGSGRPRGDEDPVRAAGFAVIVSKSPILGRTFDPQVIVLVNELADPPSDLVQVCESVRAGMTEPKTVTPTRETRLGETPAARLDFQGLVDGTPVRATALCVARDRRVFVVVGQALAADFASVASTFETILSSFRLN